MRYAVFSLLFFLIGSAAAAPYRLLVEGPSTRDLGYGEWLIDRDGEWDLMRKWIRPGDTVFDVGANVGEWSAYALQLDRSIELHVFEPLPAIFPILQRNLSQYPRVNEWNLALSDQVGRGEFCFYDETVAFSALSGFYVREVLKADHNPPKIIEVVEDTLTHFCSERSIAHIHFLKIDAEGAEWRIIQGARDLLEKGQIDAIQFEYGGCYLDAGTTLEEVYRFLKGYGFAIYRIIPNGLIEVRDWDPSLENYRLSNYAAIKNLSR